MTVTMNISLPRSLRTFVGRRVKARGYGSTSEYLRDLVRRDELEAAREHLRGMLAEGFASTPGRPWSEIKAELGAQLRARRARR